VVLSESLAKKITWSRGLLLPKGLLEKDANPQGVGNNFKASRQQQVTGDGLQRGCKSLWHLLPLTPLFLVAFFKLLGSREWLRTQVG
jgi:hypothetical protein